MNVVRARSLSQIKHSFYSLWRAEMILRHRKTVGLCPAAGYNDRSCCVEIFKVSLTVTEVKSNARTSRDEQAIN